MRVDCEHDRLDDNLEKLMPNMHLMGQRLYTDGGAPQQHRMIEGKRRTLARAVHYSYNGGFVKPVDSEMDWARALIIQNKLKEDYDDKVICYDPKAYINRDGTPAWNIQVGDIFDWMNTGTKWLIYLQDLTELAYFRGDIRRCRYLIRWKDAQHQDQSTYAAVRGPVETKINYTQKSQDSVDTPNHSLNFLIPYNKANYEFFRRYTRFYLQLGIDRESKDRELDQKICWRVEAVNAVSTPGIIEVTAVEYYADKDRDDVEDGIPNGLVQELIDPNPGGSGAAHILGPTFIKPSFWETYTCSSSGLWTCEAGPRKVEMQVNEDGSVKVRWPYLGKGQFTLKCGDKEKIVVVQPLFEEGDWRL